MTSTGDVGATGGAKAYSIGIRANAYGYGDATVDAQGAVTSPAGPAILAQSQSGTVTETGASLDFAIQGDAWFAAQSDAGTIVTRDGRFKMAETGELVTLEGHSVLDAGGAPVQLNAAGGKPIVSNDGIVRQDGNVISSIGLFEYQPTADFRRHGRSGIIAESEPQPVVNTQGVGMLQGFVEESNVNPIEEMSKLIIVHRTFDQIAAAIRDTEGSQEKAIETLGSG